MVFKLSDFRLISKPGLHIKSVFEAKRNASNPKCLKLVASDIHHRGIQLRRENDSGEQEDRIARPHPSYKLEHASQEV